MHFSFSPSSYPVSNLIPSSIFGTGRERNGSSSVEKISPGNSDIYTSEYIYIPFPSKNRTMEDFGIQSPQPIIIPTVCNRAFSTLIIGISYRKPLGEMLEIILESL